MPLFWVKCCSVGKSGDGCVNLAERKLAWLGVSLWGRTRETPVLFRFGPKKWAFFWSKSEIETPETPETRGTPETLWAHGLLMPEIFFESPVILLRQYVKELAGKDNVSGGGRQDQNGMSRF